MKKFLTLLAMPIIGTALFAQADEVVPGRTYIVKSLLQFAPIRIYMVTGGK